MRLLALLLLFVCLSAPAWAACPSQSVEDANSTAPDGCSCVPGHWRPPPGDQCIGCPPNRYKDRLGNGECTPCPPNSQSPHASSSIAQCTCNQNYIRTQDEKCVPPNCTANSVISSTPTSPEDCNCVAGYEKQDDKTCGKCKSGFYKEGTDATSCIACPSHSGSLPGSTSVSNCICNPGYVQNDNSVCVVEPDQPDPNFSVKTVLHLINISFNWYLNNAASFQGTFRSYIASVLGVTYQDVDVIAVTQGSVIVSFNVGADTAEAANGLKTTLSSLISSNFALTNLVGTLGTDCLEDPDEPATIGSSGSSVEVVNNAENQNNQVDLGLVIGIPLSVIFMILVAVGIYFYRKRTLQNTKPKAIPTVVVMSPQTVDLSPSNDSGDVESNLSGSLAKKKAEELSSVAIEMEHAPPPYEPPVPLTVSNTNTVVHVPTVLVERPKKSKEGKTKKAKKAEIPTIEVDSGTLNLDSPVTSVENLSKSNSSLDIGQPKTEAKGQLSLEVPSKGDSLRSSSSKSSNLSQQSDGEPSERKKPRKPKSKKGKEKLDLPEVEIEVVALDEGTSSGVLGSSTVALS